MNLSVELEMLASPALQQAIPTAEEQRQVLGAETSNLDFLRSGFLAASALVRALGTANYNFNGSERVLDFGCGCARVMRWLSPPAPDVKFFGADISGLAIAWCQEHADYGSFSVCAPEPPLSFPDGYFDCIYSVSVLTHLDERLQFAWLEELARVVRPGGIVLQTVAGSDVAKWHLPADDFRKFQSKGYLYRTVAEGGLDGLPAFYQTAYHSRDYIKQEWSKYFEIISYVAKGTMYLQDQVVMRRKGDQRAPANATDIRLPIGQFDTPAFGTTLRGDQLIVTGWFLDPTGRVTPQIQLDGEPIARISTHEPTPGIAKVFRVFEEAGQCGFSVKVDAAGLAPGVHLLSATRLGEEFPAALQYFLV